MKQKRLKIQGGMEVLLIVALGTLRVASDIARESPKTTTTEPNEHTHAIRSTQSLGFFATNGRLSPSCFPMLSRSSNYVCKHSKACTTCAYVTHATLLYDEVYITRLRTRTTASLLLKSFGGSTWYKMSLEPHSYLGA
eukprot:4177651-Amphidinium_carterae.2